MKCPSCGKNTLSDHVEPRHETRFGGAPFVVKNAQFRVCSNCGERIVSMIELARWRTLQPPPITGGPA